MRRFDSIRNLDMRSTTEALLGRTRMSTTRRLRSCQEITPTTSADGIPVGHEEPSPGRRDSAATPFVTAFARRTATPAVGGQRGQSGWLRRHLAGRPDHRLREVDHSRRPRGTRLASGGAGSGSQAWGGTQGPPGDATRVARGVGCAGGTDVARRSGIAAAVVVQEHAVSGPGTAFPRLSGQPPARGRAAPGGRV